MTAILYTRDILRLASTIPFLERFEELEGVAEHRSPTCGSRVRIAVRLDPEGRVTSLRQAVEACAFGQAAAALMAAGAKGRSAGEIRLALGRIQAWLDGNDEEVSSWPGLAMLSPARSRKGRHGAILLPFRALLAAIEEMR